MTRRLFVVVAVLGFTVVATGCSAPAPPSSAPQATDTRPDVAAEERAIREADSRWLKAAQASDAAGEAAVFASDSVVYREHVPPLVGPAAYQSFLAKFRGENPKAKTDWSTTSIQLAGAGDMAVQTGEYHVTGLGLKGEGEDTGRFLTVWKKVNGEWKVAHDIGSTTMPDTSQKQK